MTDHAGASKAPNRLASGCWPRSWMAGIADPVQGNRRLEPQNGSHLCQPHDREVADLTRLDSPQLRLRHGEFTGHLRLAHAQR